MRGPQNGDSTKESTRGSSLNLRWVKWDVWWVDQWVPISWLHIASSWYHWMHAWLLYSFGTLTCWLCWLIILIKDSDIATFLCFIAIFVWDIDMLIVLIDYLACLSIVTLILPWLFCSLHMHRLTVVYHLTWCVNSLGCISSW